MTQIYGPNELLEDVHKRDLCIGCGACVELCPYFKNHKGKTVMLFPCTIAQGRCYAFCPKVEVDLDELSERLLGHPYEGEALGSYEKIVTARAGEKAGGGSFQAGGTVTALMTLALNSGMIKAAVLTDREGLTPVARLVTESEKVAEYAASKYMAAPTLAALNQGIREGYRQIGVVGTPCQMMAVAQMKLNALEREEYQEAIGLSVGLFCTWALDTRALISFLSERMDISQIKGMDIPPPPAEIFVVDTGKEKIEFPLDEIRPLVPNSCLVCPDMTSEWADVSVGVLEGKPDWNTMIIRTESGREIVDRAVQEGYLITEEMPEENLEHLIWAAGNKKKRAIIRAGEQELLNRIGEGERSLFKLAAETITKITA